MSLDSHPSFYDFDLWALGVRTPALESHVGLCARCQIHLQRVAAPSPLPAAVRERALDPWTAVMRRWRAVWLTGGLVAASAAALMVARLPSTARETGVKGGPSIALYVKHDASVSLWNGSMPVRPGDRIQLKIAAEGLSHVAVGSVEAGQPVSWLYTGLADSGAPLMLPTSWIVDDAPGPEQLTIVLSRRALSLEELDADSRSQVRDENVWTTRLELPKK